MTWDADSLWLKAKTFVDRSNAVSHNDPQFGFWSALALELLARAALSNIHPTLNADPGNVRNLLYALGFDISGQPRSVSAHSVYERLEMAIPDFGKAERKLCEYLGLLRNRDLHTADLSFENLQEGEWIGRYYSVCKVLCESIGKNLEEYLGDDTAITASSLIEANKKSIKKSALDKISKRRTWFGDHSEEKRQELEIRAGMITDIILKESDRATKNDCPACSCPGILIGTLAKEHRPRYDGEHIVIDQEFLATAFHCPACELKLTTLGEIVHADIEPRFSRSRFTSLHELFEPDLFDEYMNE